MEKWDGSIRVETKRDVLRRIKKGKFSDLELNIINIIQEFKNELNRPKLLAIIRERKILHKERDVIKYDNHGRPMVSHTGEMKHLNPLLQNLYEARVFRRDTKGRFILLDEGMKLWKK